MVTTIYTFMVFRFENLFNKALYEFHSERGRYSVTQLPKGLRTDCEFSVHRNSTARKKSFSYLSDFRDRARP